MRYMILIYGKESDWEGVSPERAGEIMGAYNAYTAKLKAAGVHISGDELNVVSTAKSVRGVGGSSVIDGPFVDTKEQLGGYYLIECASGADALDWAKQAPTMMHGGGVELRPIMVR
jgi:hypothetical protein